MNGINDNIILSLCISTYYNRGNILDRTISSIVTDPAFDQSVELIIIDNGSTDNTCQVCTSYMQKYNNVFYYKNSINIGNKNFTKVLKQGHGVYVKFLNDTQSFKPGKLKMVKDFVLKYKNSKSNLLFVRNVGRGLLRQKKIIKCNNKNEVLSNLSFYTTWSGNFGSYSSFFYNIENPNRAADLKFPQVDWIYSLASSRPTIIVIDDFYNVEATFSKGNWNFLNVFTTCYFKVLRIHFNYSYAFEREKWRIFKLHLVPFYYVLTSKKKEFDYDNNHAFQILMKYYKYNIFAYGYLLLYCMIKKIIK